MRGGFRGRAHLRCAAVYPVTTKSTSYGRHRPLHGQSPSIPTSDVDIPTHLGLSPHISISTADVPLTSAYRQTYQSRLRTTTHLGPSLRIPTSDADDLSPRLITTHIHLGCGRPLTSAHHHAYPPMIRTSPPSPRPITKHTHLGCGRPTHLGSSPLISIADAAIQPSQYSV